MTANLTFDVVLARLALSFAAACLLGWNREEIGHPAGLRTLVLICISACTAMLLGDRLLTDIPSVGGSPVKLDLMRLAQGILAGIGFIGAGTILKQGDIVRGVTTAATVWSATVIGLCFGAGAWPLGIAATALTLGTLQGLGAVEAVLRRRSYGTVTVEFDPRETSHAALLETLRAAGLGVRSRSLETAADTARLRCVGAHRTDGAAWSLGLVDRLSAMPGVGRVSWEELA